MKMTKIRHPLALGSPLFCAWLLLAPPAAMARASATLDDKPAAPAVAAAPAPLTESIGPWWKGFGDADLDRLVTLARARSASSEGLKLPRLGASPTQMTAAAVRLREHALRGALVDEMLKVLAQQRSLWADGAPTLQRAAQLEAIDQRIASVRRIGQHHAQLRDEQRDALEAMTGLHDEAERLALQIDPAQTEVPQFHQAAPERIAVGLLTARSDVGAAWARAARADAFFGGSDAAAAQAQRGLQGWIVPSTQGLPPTQTARDQSAGELGSVVDEAAREVSRVLFGLQAAQTLCEAAIESAKASQLELQAERLRSNAGQSGPAEVLERYSRLLAQTDEVLARKATLALAWVQLHAALGAD